MRKTKSARAKKRVKGDEQIVTPEQFEAMELEMRVALIQELIPLGLMAAAGELQREVAELAGTRYERRDAGGARRFGAVP